MGAVDTPDRRSKGGKKGLGFGKAKRRVGVRIDMTPMVDVAFLLLIFFMVTTVFRTPQALEINLPPEQKNVDVAESKILEVRILGDTQVYWKDLINKSVPWTRTSSDKIADVFKPYRGHDKIILVKIDKEARFDNMVQTLDELHTSQLGRFSIIKLEDKDKQEVANL